MRAPITILVVDDDSRERASAAAFCKQLGFRVIAVAASEFARALLVERPRVLLIDEHNMSGLVNRDDLDGIAVLVGIAPTALDRVFETALAVGTDYVQRPYRGIDLQHRLATVLRWHDEAERAREVAAMALDPSMSTGTAQELMMSLEYEFVRAERYRRPTSCLVVRIDNLSALLEPEAPDAGLVARQLDLGIRSMVRLVDHLFRSAASEFSVVLPETDAAGAAHVVERIRTGADDLTLWPTGFRERPAIRVAAASYPSDEVESGAALHARAKSRL